MSSSRGNTNRNVNTAKSDWLMNGQPLGIHSTDTHLPQVFQVGFVAKEDYRSGEPLQLLQSFLGVLEGLFVRDGVDNHASVGPLDLLQRQREFGLQRVETLAEESHREQVGGEERKGQRSRLTVSPDTSTISTSMAELLTLTVCL